VRLGKTEALDALAPALSEGAERGDLPAAAARTAHYLFFAGRHELADRLLAATGEATDTEPDRDAWVARACATRALLAGDISTYLEHLDHAIAVFEEVGDVREQAAERVNAGFARMELGLWPDAESTLRGALEGAERAGLRHVEAVARVNLGETLFRMGRPGEALTYLDAAVGALRRQGNRRMEGNARLYRARLHLAGGELEAAERDAQSAVEALGHVPPLLPMALGVLASVQLAARQLEKATSSAREAVRRAEAELRLDEGEGFVRLVGIDVALAIGDNDEAWRGLHKARGRLLERAGRVARDDWRESFLQVPEHARTLQLFAAWVAAAPRGPGAAEP
jgi:tetratricopeptide (TPR) repeat protein